MGAKKPEKAHDKLSVMCVLFGLSGLGMSLATYKCALGQFWPRGACQNCALAMLHSNEQGA